MKVKRSFSPPAPPRDDPTVKATLDADPVDIDHDPNFRHPGFALCLFSRLVELLQQSKPVATNFSLLGRCLDLGNGHQRIRYQDTHHSSTRLDFHYCVRCCPLSLLVLLEQRLRIRGYLLCLPDRPLRARIYPPVRLSASARVNLCTRTTWNFLYCGLHLPSPATRRRHGIQGSYPIHETT